MTIHTPPARKNISRLHRQALLVTLLYTAGILAGFLPLRVQLDSATAWRWLLLASLFALRPLWLLWRGLVHNHRTGEETLLSTLGVGNAITLVRGLLIAGLGGFLFTGPLSGLSAWLPALLYMMAALLDGLDGYAARATDQVTELGVRLDMALDGLGVLAAVAVGVAHGRLPLWYLPVGFSRELFVAGLWWRERRELPIYPLPPSRQRRIAAGLQMGFLGMVLWPLFSAPATTLAAALFGAQLLLSFGRDWLVVSGVLNADSDDPRSAAYLRWRRRAKRLLFVWMPPLLRLAGAGLALLILWHETPDFATWGPYLAAHDWPASPAGLWAVTLLTILGLLLLIPAHTARVAAILLLLLALFDQLAAGFAWPTNGLLEVCAILLVQVGGGEED